MKDSIPYVVLILLLILISIFVKDKYLDHKVSEKDTVTVVDTVIVQDSIQSTVLVSQMNTKTIVVDSTKYINYNDLLLEALRMYGDSIVSFPKEFIAEKDTVVKDSLVTVSARLSSPLPFHPDTKVDLKVNYSIPTVTITNTITETVTPILTHGISVGSGYGVFNQKFDLFIGYSLQFNLGKIF